MKWFKHYHNASISNSLTELMAETGLEGYGRYWRLLELMSEKFDGQEDEEFVFETKRLKGHLKFYHTNALLMYLECIANVGLMSFQSGDNVIRITSDILLRLQGRDFKRAHIKRETTAPKNKIKNKIKNKNNIPTFDFESLYQKYPRKEGKKNGLAICNREINTPEKFSLLDTAIQNYVKLCEHEKTEKRYIKHFSAFMSVWEDYIGLGIPQAKKRPEMPIEGLRSLVLEGMSKENIIKRYPESKKHFEQGVI